MIIIMMSIIIIVVVLVDVVVDIARIGGWVTIPTTTGSSRSRRYRQTILETHFVGFLQRQWQSLNFIQCYQFGPHLELCEESSNVIVQTPTHIPIIRTDTKHTIVIVTVQEIDRVR
jgi:hypothetical protein